VNYYDGQGFLIRKELGVNSAKDLDGASVCIQTGTTTELNLADFFRVNGISYEPVAIETNEEGIANYSANRCDTYTTDASALASIRAALDDPSAHIILPEIISKEPLAGAVRHGDDQWADIGKWVVNAIIIAEELGVTQANVKQLAGAAGNNPLRATWVPWSVLIKNGLFVRFPPSVTMRNLSIAILVRTRRSAFSAVLTPSGKTAVSFTPHPFVNRIDDTFGALRRPNSY